MQSNNPFFDDLAKMATSAGATMLEWRKETEKLIQTQFEKWSTKMDLVSREEFDVVRELAQKAVLENEDLKKRVALLEAKAPASKVSATKKTVQKTKAATKKTPSKAAATKANAQKTTKKATTKPTVNKPAAEKTPKSAENG